MNNLFSQKVSDLLVFARKEADRLSSQAICPEHILLGVLHDDSGKAAEFLKHLNINYTSLKETVEHRIIDEYRYESASDSEISLTEQASNILRLAVLEARLQHSQMVDVHHVLLAILHDKAHTAAKEILNDNNIKYEDMQNYLAQKTNSGPVDGLFMSDDDEGETPEYDNRSDRDTAAATKGKDAMGGTPVIDNFSVDLTRAAAEGKLDPVVGRDEQILRVTEILCRRKKNNPILIGEPGVGKSAIVEGLAQMIVEQKTSPLLFNKRLINLDLTAIVAGTKYRGQFEERIRALLKELENNPDIIVFIDEIHTMIGAGSTPGSMDAANIMKPALARGTIQCIGATTFDEYRNSIEKDGALERRFQKVLVEPTSAEDTLCILQNIKSRYEEHHHVEYTDEALKACVRLADRYISDRSFPDKAIDVLDEAGSHVHLSHATIPAEIRQAQKELAEIKDKKQSAAKKQNFELAISYRDRELVLEKELADMRSKWMSGESEQREKVSEADIAEVVATMTGVPVRRISEGETAQLKTLAATLKQTVIAQDEAVEKVSKAIMRNRVGLKSPNQPIGVFMFLGPTGVGKTHLAKKIAEHLFGSTDSLIRIDMSEYAESFTTSRLVGAPPGYVGYNEGGQLSEKVRRHPYSVVLLDEIEKAHSNVFNMLLQVLDEGRLTDGNGRLVDFRNTIIIMTSNAGTRQLKDFGRGIGFSKRNILGADLDEDDKRYARDIIMKSLSKQFAPEFLNRLDDVITFDQLSIEALEKIVDIQLADLSERLLSMGYRLSITDAAKSFVANHGYDVQFGARPLRRAIQTYIEDKLSEALISEEFTPGQTIVIDKITDKDELSFTVETENNADTAQPS
ncbi:Clp protease ClpC [Prevotella sp. P4-51]|jgi:ATP-dependent Clp protease ATP-binding subunit ClpC|uniref:ATP-dependent Clp protease ATP-binding subunit n=1 Tax=Prevotella TaxID=838 RepID=UPI000B960A23|nr:MULTISPECIES: ATP-dependent Clp protease ATP-binding subunit [Prevotella]MCF2636583.1 ATP-dependent Clp protease ATP-binding subunit [Prevotella dentalis]MEE0621035.1 ATP-dependent Clp protease ATP-binding subunit [Prevotella sp.]OYP63899.1 Clp protease ClpC [Prevotella sp. P5-108]OYP77555.1 Clp protease ClpC [Prevotella sp. P4-51]